jgi:NADP-dependent 3-hydroxy acid dehydrogenase YdfG
MSSVLITGASQGIGRATAAELSRRGHHVIATARKLEDLDGLDVAARLWLDVTDQASIDAAFAEAGEVDALISNAGVAFSASVESLPPEDLERIFAVNTSGTLRVTQAVLPAMRERGAGHIVYVSSLLGRVALPMRSATRRASGRSRRSERRLPPRPPSSGSGSPWSSPERSTPSAPPRRRQPDRRSRRIPMPRR